MHCVRATQAHAVSRDPRASRAAVRSRVKLTVPSSSQYRSVEDAEEVVARRKELPGELAAARPALPASRATGHRRRAWRRSPACAMRHEMSASEHASSVRPRSTTSATVAWTACAQSCEGERSAAPRRKISWRVRAPAFAGVTTGSGGTRNALGSTLGALQRPHATCYHLRPLC